MIIRNLYLDTIRPYFNTKLVKILTGVRRSGKSTILEMVKDELIKNGVSEDKILFLHLDSFQLEKFKTGLDLYNYIKERLTDGRTYIFLDEVQEVEEWEKAINSLMVDFDVDIYITGSNSKLMSSEISTYLTGRYISIPVYPLSYKEYIDFKKGNDSYIQGYNYLDDFIKLGGFPTIALNNFSQNSAYVVIKDIYNSVVFTDIVKRNNIRNVELFERVVKFIFENIGKTFSALSITKYLKSDGRNIDKETIYNYISFLEKAFLIYRVNRFDLQGKEVLKTLEKYYLSDQGLKFAMCSYNSTMIASIMENIVFLELIRRGYDVYIGKYDTKEVDFVGMKDGGRIYIQVCRNLPENSEREILNLRRLGDNFPKYIVTLDSYDSANVDGTQVIYLADFLLSDKY